MIWIVCSLVVGGIFIGVFFLALLTAAKKGEARPSLSGEADTGRSRRTSETAPGRLRTLVPETRAGEQPEGLRQAEA